VWNYPGTRATKSRNDGLVLVGRGNSYADRAELMLATERNSEGQLDRLLPSHRTESWGFRPAWYPVAGADLTLPLALAYNGERSHPALPCNWLPPPAGFARRSDKACLPYLGFEVARTAGVLRRDLADDDPGHVFVRGPAEGIAFLPVKGLAAERVLSVDTLRRAARDPAQCVVLGVLTGTMGSGFRYAPEPGRTDTIAFDDERWTNRHELAHHIGRQFTREHLGALVVLEDSALVLYAPNESFYSARRPEHREGRLGTLDDDPVLEEARAAPPTGTRNGDDVTLSAFLPFLDRQGVPVTDGAGIRLTFTVRYVPHAVPR
jgi:hypothetical protein